MSETEFLQLCNFFWQDASFTKVYNSSPHVFVSANHSTKNGSQSPMHNSIAEWVEVCFYLFIYLLFNIFMNLCNIPLATTLTCVVCMFKNLMNFKIRITVQYVAQYPDTWNKNSIFELPFLVLGKRSILNESWTFQL